MNIDIKPSPTVYIILHKRDTLNVFIDDRTAAVEDANRAQAIFGGESVTVEIWENNFFVGYITPVTKVVFS